jgi:hypothetical protein
MWNKKWKVISSHEPSDVIPEKELKEYGLKGFNCNKFKISEILCLTFLRLLFKNWKQKVEMMNAAIEAAEVKCRPFSEREFLIGLAILIGAAEFAKRGSDLFSVRDKDEEDEGEIWASLCPESHFEKYMAFGQWKELSRFFPEAFVDISEKEGDPWYQFSSAVEEFNEIRQSELVCSSRVSVDETMCAWRPRKTATGGVPNISFIIRKPEPLGKVYSIY